MSLALLGELLDLSLLVDTLEHLKVVLELGPSEVKYFALVVGLLGLNILLLIITALFLLLIHSKCCGVVSESHPRWIQLVMGLTVLISLLDLMVACFGNRTELLLHQA